MVTALFRRPRREGVPCRPRTAIIDIGSNSVRLVVYEGPARLPAILFNEKVMAGLGRGLAGTGAIEPAALATARAALARFTLLAREMQVSELRTVATAAVRDASNGDALMVAAQALDLAVELLSGEEEAMASGLGVLSGIPDANGVVGDLGGGSLELVRVEAGTVTDSASFPLGVLRLGAIRVRGRTVLDREVARLIAAAGWKGRGKGLPFYLVGGSWRSLAKLDMYLTGYPLPIVQQYPIAIARIAELGRHVEGAARADLKMVPDLSSARVPMLADAAAVLLAVAKQLGSAGTVVSAYGLREGLLFQRLSAEERRQDPLIVAAREEGQRLGRFPEHGDLLDAWLAPLFQDSHEWARLRHAACLLADVGWRANPEFRAERGMEIGLHGNWVGIDAAGRAMVAQALYTSLGGATDSPEPLPRLAPSEALAEAKRWGLAMRLGQRLGGGVAAPLKRSRLRLEEGALVLSFADGDAPLYGEAVEKRHRALAGAMGREPVLET